MGSKRFEKSQPFFKDAKSRPGCTNACARAARGRHGDLLIISITGFDFELDLEFYQIHFKIPSPVSRMANGLGCSRQSRRFGGFAMLKV